MSDSELSIKAKELIIKISFEDKMLENEVIFLLKEMSRRLDTLNIIALKLPDGILLTDNLGRSRYATFCERIVYGIFNMLPKEL